MHIAAAENPITTIFPAIAIHDAITPTKPKKNFLSEKSPKHALPKYGTLFSRQYLAAQIMPSMPRLPKPPGTSTPLQDCSCAQASSYVCWFSVAVFASKFVDSIHSISSDTPASIAE